MAKPPSADSIIRNIKKKQRSFEPKTPIADDMFLPNLSGDHSRGRVNTTPTTDFEIANKKYVDDNSTSPGGDDTQVQFNDGGVFGGDAEFTYNKTTDVLTTDGLTISDTGQILASPGTGGSNAPPYSFRGLTTTGIRATDGSGMTFHLGGTQSYSFNNNQLQVHFSGTASKPAFTFSTDKNTGMYRGGVDALDLSAGGLIMLRCHETTQNEVIINPTAIDIDFRAASDTNTHMLFVDAGNDKVGINNSGPVCDLDVNGGFAANLTSQTGTYTALTTDHTILCGAGNETFTVTLPAATGVTGLIYNIKNIGTGTITVDGADSETIDGGLTAVLNNQFESITIQCDGSNWHII